MSPEINDLIHMVITHQHDAQKRGVVSMWTIYRRPRDYPEGYIARAHEAGKGGSVPTDMTIRGDSDSLQMLRTVFAEAGLTCLTRSPQDDPNIVEVWL
jgi:hypothetical protein